MKKKTIKSVFRETYIFVVLLYIKLEFKKYFFSERLTPVYYSDGLLFLSSRILILKTIQGPCFFIDKPTILLILTVIKQK